MSGLFSSNLFGTIPQWITAITSSAVLGLVGTLTVAFWRRGVSLKTLENADEADIRDHYAQELERNTSEIGVLRDQLRSMELHYRDMLSKSDRRHEECEAARHEMREELNGLRAQLRTQASDRVLALEEGHVTPSKHVADAARRVKKIIEDEEGGPVG